MNPAIVTPWPVWTEARGDVIKVRSHRVRFCAVSPAGVQSVRENNSAKAGARLQRKSNNPLSRRERSGGLRGMPPFFALVGTPAEGPHGTL